MPREIELKLRLDPAAADAMAMHPALAGAEPARKPLLNTYYDTPDLALRQAGIALRFRRSGTQWLLTVKGGNPASGALASRSEWEVEREPGVFDFSHVDDPSMRELLEAARPALEPVFTTDFRRTVWRIPSTSGGGVEIARDIGSIIAGKRREALCEVELERYGAEDTAPLFALGLYLADRLPLHPEARSKAERGYALYAGLEMRPRKTAPTPVRESMTPVEAFQAVALDCLDQLMRNEAGAIDGSDPEFVHQARVGIRRLRSAFGLFAPALPKQFVRTYSTPWREVANALGEGRDWDVLMHETLPRFIADRQAHKADYKIPPRLTKAAGKAHDRALATARVALRHPGYSRFLLLFARDVDALADAATPRTPGALAGFARAALDRQLRRVWRIAEGTRLKTHEHRHELRIALKKLRYATDFFTPLLPPRALRRYRRRIAALQDILGRLNDLVIGRGLIAGLRARKGPDPLDNWLAAEHGRIVRSLAGALKKLRKAAPPWR